ncbi:MAG: ATP-dependent DNA helicase, partial [Actinobacteria bacterium]|nr:ATP-dependent DNA helicase [Actinomycetota bacterium]
MPAGEDRPGQREMVDAIAHAINDGEHLVVQAGTGTGKSLAYLIPAVLSGRRVVVATATKALQDQLADKDLPLLAEHIDAPLSWAVLKGRSNYLCRQRLDEALQPQTQLGLDGVADAADSSTGGSEGRVPLSELKALAAWADDTESGDRADLTVEPKPWVWAAVSVGPRECPGASKCPRGADCFAEQARSRAAAADVVVVNTHLYGLHLAAGGVILPDHDVVIFDEAHEVEDIMSATTGIEVGPGSVNSLARTISSLIADESLIDHLETNAQRLGRQLEELVGSRLRHGVPAEVADTLLAIRERVNEVTNAVRSIDDRANAEVKTRKERVAKAAGGLLEDLHYAISPPADTVMWVGGTPEHPKIEMAPLDVGATLDDLLWNPEPSGLDFDFGAGAVAAPEATGDAAGTTP